MDGGHKWKGQVESSAVEKSLENFVAEKRVRTLKARQEETLW